MSDEVPTPYIDIAPLTTLDPSAGLTTIINTYTVAPEDAEALVALLVRLTIETLRYIPGFVSANLHISLDRTKVVNYAQWQSRAAIAAAGADPEVSACIQQAAKLVTSFTPVLYELRQSIAANHQ